MPTHHTFGCFSHNSRRGFTLIELSIVLVIIGLVVGGVLVGRDLVSAAGVRAQISQIEEYQQAVNTFRGKYGYLPGDLPDPDASRFGFMARGSAQGQGDGNGILQCATYHDDEGQDVPPYYELSNTCAYGGETAVFWKDLSQAKLIKGSFTKATMDPKVSPPLHDGDYFPKGRIGSEVIILTWSGGWNPLSGDGQNYVSIVGSAGSPSMTVAQAYAIDRKTDDGLPQYGRVIAYTSQMGWSVGGLEVVGDFASSESLYSPAYNGPVTDPRDINNETPSQYTCYDGSHGLPEQYSVDRNGGRGLNCALSFRFH